MGASLLLDSIKLVKEKRIIDFKKQEHEHSTKAPKIKKEQLKIDWNDSALKIHNLIRSLSYLGVYTLFKDKRIKLYNSYWNNSNKILGNGEFILKEDFIYIGCNSSLLIIKELQVEGKKKIKAKDFFNGLNKECFKFG